MLLPIVTSDEQRIYTVDAWWGGGGGGPEQKTLVVLLCEALWPSDIASTKL